MPYKLNKLTDEHRQRIARLVRQARGNARLTIEAAADAARISHMTWINVEHARPVRASSYRAVERAFGWDHGAIDIYAAGGDPPPMPAAPAPAVDQVRPAVDIDVVLALRHPDAVKVTLIKILRAGGDPLDRILDLDVPDARKVELIRALREAQDRMPAAAEAKSA